MKTFSAAGPFRALDRRRAWLCIATNQLACPGLGTLMAGRRMVGYIQLAMMVTGFLLFMGPLLRIIYREIQVLLQPVTDISDHLDHYRHYWWLLILGGGLCFTSWIWSGWSAVGFLKEAKKLPPPVKRVPPVIRDYAQERKTAPLISA
jgi:hypothetical protein